LDSHRSGFSVPGSTARTVTAPPLPTVTTLDSQYPPMPSVRWCATRNLASVVTVGSGGAVTVRAVLPGTLKPDLWESKGSWYDPAAHRATFLVTDSASGFFNHWQPDPGALASLGRPARTYHVGTYTVYVWNKNLLVQVSHAGR
jgi:hypothetical protein